MADAVLLEGYVLYPYRASAAKNRLRWQFGVLVPPAWGRAHEEHVFQQTEILMEPRGAATLALELRFLHAQRRTVEQAADDGGFTEVAELHLADRVLVPWDEGTEERVEVSVPVAELLGDDGVTFPSTAPPASTPSPSRTPRGAPWAAWCAVPRRSRACCGCTPPNSPAPTGC